MRAAIRAIILGGYDRDALEWKRAVIAGGGAITSAQTKLVSDLIKSLKGTGVWPTLDRLWLFAAENSTQALIDLKARASATNHSAVFTAGRGFKGDGSAQYIDTGFNPSTAGGNYTQNNASQSCWVETAESTTASLKGYIGGGGASVNSFIGRANLTQYLVGVNGGGSSVVTIAFSTQPGLWQADRTSSSLVTAYQNGSSAGTNASPSGALYNETLLALAINVSASPADFTNGRVASVQVGASMGAAGQAAFYAAMRAYMTAQGVA